MLISTSNQAYIFLSSVYMGIIIGIIYDIYRVIHILVEMSKSVTMIMDIFFWIIVTMLSIVGFFYVSSGEIRVYSIVGLAIGWALYILTVSRYIRHFITVFGRGIIRLCRKIIKCLTYPFQWIIDLIEKPKRMWKECKKNIERRLNREKIKDEL